MKTMKRTRLVAAVALCFGASALTIQVAHAQQTQQVEKIQVTGSNIKRVDTETTSPVVTITREQIKQSGMRDVA